LKKALKTMVQSEGLPFKDLLRGEVMEEILHAIGYTYRERLYCPYVTLWCFLSEVISSDKSCEAAVLRLRVDRAQQGKPLCSTETTAYCKARQRLPEELYSKLAQSIGMELMQKAPEEWLWKCRQGLLVDGTTSIMPDTEENQKEFPQHSNQKKGLGFPSARIGLLTSLATGAVVAGAIGPVKGKGTGEIELFREMRNVLRRGNIVIGDCLYDSYRDVAELRAEGVDVVFGMKQSRQCDFTKGEQLGPGDHIVVWKRPDFDSSRFNRETWETLPETIRMRELMINVKFRGELHNVRVVTTLLDASVYTAADIMSLFRQRWNVELDIRCIKTVLGMDRFTCKTPSMVRKEFYTYLLAYNLIRVRMAQAAKLHDKKPREISFKACKAAMTIWLPVIASAGSERERDTLERLMLDTIASRTVSDRPGRSEPRKIKRRPPSKYPSLTKRRAQEQQRLKT